MNRGGGKKRGRGRGCSPIHATINLDRCVGMDCNTTSPGLESGSMPVGREKFNDSSPGCKTEFLHDGEGKLRMTSVSHVNKQVGCKSADGKLENSSCVHKNSSFDMCPSKNVGKLKPSLLSRNKERRTEMRCHIEGDTHEILRSGMILLRGYLSFPDQVKLIKTCRDLGLDISGFYKPGYSNGAKLNLMMMCLGKNWDPETSNYTDERPFDGAIPPPIPREFQQLVKGAIQECHAILKSHSQVRSVEDVLPSMSPNICIVNFYSETGTLGLHQDKDESQESLRKKLPVVSFSIGDSAEFLYADERNIEKAQKVILKSGDVLIFGGKARHIFHGITSIKPGTAPKSLLEETNLKPGRLNLTFREY